MRKVLSSFIATVVCFGVFTSDASQLWAANSNVFVEPSVTLVRQMVTVNPISYSSYSFRLPAGTTLVAGFHVDGGLDNSIKVWLLDQENFLNFQAGRGFNYYKGTSGSIRGIGKYTFVVPQANVYFLVIDNREAILLPRNVNVYVYTTLTAPTPELLQSQKYFQAVYDALKQIFIFKDITISFRHCGFENAFSNPNITMCTELMETLGAQGLDAADGFILFHEMGHSLLNLWGYPFYDNEDVADEFASVFMLLLKDQNSAIEAAKWFANQTSEEEAKAKIWIDDRHTLSPQRARNILRWLSQSSDLLRKWQKILVPTMQTAVLQELDKGSEIWIDHALTREELGRRALAIR